MLGESPVARYCVSGVESEKSEEADGKEEQLMV